MGREERTVDWSRSVECGDGEHDDGVRRFPLPSLSFFSVGCIFCSCCAPKTHQFSCTGAIAQFLAIVHWHVEGKTMKSKGVIALLREGFFLPV
jgi:hypothetical protein